MDYVKKSIEKRALHKMEYDSRVNAMKVLMQTKEEKVDSSKALDASLVIIESIRTESKEQDTSSRSGNDAHVDDADIKPIYDEEPMVEIQTTAEINIFATGQQHTISLTNVEANKALNVSPAYSLSTADQASVFMAMTFVHISSGLVLHQMMSDHNSSDLAPQRQEMSVENVSSGLVPQGLKWRQIM
ncbi:hypothetical protein Tco_1234704 [Tanacetum coccineum]